MEVFNTLALFLFGFFILIKGAHYLVRGAVAIANIFRISTWFVGAVIVSFGTSVPELSVNIAAAFSGSAVGMGAVLGSNLFNVLIGLGIAAIFYPIVSHRSWVLHDFTFHIFASIVAVFLILVPLFGDVEFAGLSRGEAILMLSLVTLWVIGLWRRKVQHEEEMDVGAVTVAAALVMLFSGFVGVFLGGLWVVNGATLLATLAGVSEGIIGLTVVAFGTSLPEVSVSFIALMRGNVGIGVGNIIGTNIMNLFAVFGIAALVHPLELTESLSLTFATLITMSILLLAFMFVGKRYTLSRPEGVVFIALYILFLALLLLT